MSYDSMIKAVFQNFGDGKVSLEDVPCPALQPNSVLVATVNSLVSAGTEKLMVDLGRKSLVGKARQRPDLVKKVLAKVRTDGLIPTFQAVKTRLDSPVPMGYSLSGIVIEAGEEIVNIKTGDHVACGGAGYASHAEIVCVPKNLCVKFNNLPFEDTAFTTLGAISMQGFRLSGARLGETVAVIGLGLVGLLAIQIAKAAGCYVAGMDINPERCVLATKLGCDRAASHPEELISHCLDMTKGHGADRVLICAGTSSHGPVELAGEVAREKGVVVAVGMVGMNVPRQLYYQKELTLKVSKSYGPGRYDSQYEEKGIDYPYAYVRWTENRNMESFLYLLAQKKIDVKSLVTHRFSIENSLKAYELISGDKKEPYLGILLKYPNAEKMASFSKKKISPKPLLKGKLTKKCKIGMIGAGAYAKGILLPAMKKVENIELVGLCTATGLKAGSINKRFGFRYWTTDHKKILNDSEINTIVIATRHNLHAEYIIKSIDAGKHVFVEKPLCLTKEEMDKIIWVYSKKENPLLLMVGYNRRYAPLAVKLKEKLTVINEPLMVNYRINAGYIAPDHWVHDPVEGGGRIIGEACHFADFLLHLIDSRPVRVYAKLLPDSNRYQKDNLSCMIEFENGSTGTICYAACGDKAMPKERIEVFGSGCSGILDNFRIFEWFENDKRKIFRSFLSQDKGQRGEWDFFVKALSAPEIHQKIFDEQIMASKIIFAILESAKKAKPVSC